MRVSILHLWTARSFVHDLSKPPLFGIWNFENYASRGNTEFFNDTGTYSLVGSLDQNPGPSQFECGLGYEVDSLYVYSPGAPFTFNTDFRLHSGDLE